MGIPVLWFTLTMKEKTRAEAIRTTTNTFLTMMGIPNSRKKKKKKNDNLGVVHIINKWVLPIPILTSWLCSNCFKPKKKKIPKPRIQLSYHIEKKKKKTQKFRERE